jgi:hypothetical protein
MRSIEVAHKCVITLMIDSHLGSAAAAPCRATGSALLPSHWHYNLESLPTQRLVRLRHHVMSGLGMLALFRLLPKGPVRT